MHLRFAVSALSVASPATADVWTFGTPSGNIECVVGEGFEGSDLECTIYSRSAPAMVPALRNCPVNRGVTFSMLDKGPVTANCARAGARPSGTQSTAEYGVEGKFAGFTCFSATSGLQCRNESGHGFHLSRSSQTAF